MFWLPKSALRASPGQGEAGGGGAEGREVGRGPGALGAEAAGGGQGAAAEGPGGSDANPLAALAVSTVLKAGEGVFQTLLWAKAVFHALKEHSHCFMHFLAPKHRLGHFSPRL